MASEDPPILNLADAPTHSGSHGEHFAFSWTSLAAPLGARTIGANVTRVPPGKAAFPLHHHHANEEHFFVLSGQGMLRLGERAWPVRPHDYIVSVAGGPEAAHQLVNTGQEDLVYLSISTLVVPDVVGYPDSAKTGVRIATGQDPDARFLVENRSRSAVGYWDGEDGRQVRALVERGQS
jgi:uncharacterized cupin superfamily protein